jgi:D-glycero-D-manno-heptose 1,7-bisphosphate phosphatase
VSAMLTRGLSGADSSSPPHGERPFEWVFLDRDGTLNVKAPEGEYVERAGDLVLLPGAAEAVKAFNRADIWTAVVTNQRGIALGRMSMQDLDAVHQRLEHLLGLEGAVVDAIYSCPHETGTCDCRKPQPGLLLGAQREHPEIDFARAAIVGDSLSDVQAGQRLGLTTVLISSEEAATAGEAGADRLVPDLRSAAQWLLCDERT